MAKKKETKQKSGQVIIPGNHPNPPMSHEVNAALALANHYHCTVEFLIPVDDYMRKSADIVMHGVAWEIKSPIGASKSTIGNQFKTASKQSGNIVIDTRRCALNYDKIEKAVLFEMKKRSTIKKVLLIRDEGNLENIVEIKK